jgi:hypothetical protein
MALQHTGIELPFTNGFYQSRSRQQSIASCINYYPVTHKQPCMSPESLYMTSGIRSAATELNGICRAAIEAKGKAYMVMGENLYLINEDETITVLGSGAPISGSSRLRMDYITDEFGLVEIIIVDPGVATYQWRESVDILGSIDDASSPNANFPGRAVDVVALNRIIYLLSDNNVLFHSNVRDSSTYNALDQFTVDDTNTAIGIQKYRGQIFVFGDKEIIPFNYIGGALFTLAPQPNAVKPYGLRGLHAKADLGKYMCFLGSRNNSESSIYVYTGGEPQKISTEVIDYELQKLTPTDLDNAFISFYSQGGGDFMFITTGDKCFLFNFESGKWHEQRSFINGVNQRWRVNAVCEAYNKILIGDGLDSNVGVLDIDERQEFGNNIHRSFSLQAFDNKGKALSVKSIILAMDAGFNGEVALDWSDDGFNWENSLVRSAGNIGQYGRTVRWNTLGSTSFFRVLRFGTSSPVDCNINKIIADA